jgi:hypothetical protein
MIKFFLDVPYCIEQSLGTDIPILPFALSQVRGTEKDSSYRFLREEMFERMESISLFDSVNTVSEAEAVFMPLDWSVVNRTAPNIEVHFRRLAEKSGLPLVVVQFADNTDDVPGGNLIVLRNSKYRKTLRSNEIICPAAVRDVGSEKEIHLLSKPERPTVGFVGISQKHASISWHHKLLKFGKRDYIRGLLSYINPEYGYQRSGLYFRTRVMDLLEQAKGIDCDFVRRNYWGRESFSRQKENAIRIRQEFTDNISRNLYLLSIRGNGNYSFRFFEILSAGRIPLIIDTDAPLPMEGNIDYQSFCLFIDGNDLSQVAKKIIDHHASCDNDMLQDMQLKAKKAFHDYLRFDVFAKNLFKETLPAMIQKGSNL